MGDAMHLDVVDLRSFYYRTRLGRAAQRSLQVSLRALWPDTRGMNVVGFGFAAPILRPFLAQSRRVISLMPAQQGVVSWPQGAENVSVLVEETAWPLATGTADRLVIVHGLEHTDQPAALLELPHRLVGRLVEHRLGPGRGQQPEVDQRRLDLRDGSALVAAPEHLAGRRHGRPLGGARGTGNPTEQPYPVVRRESRPLPLRE